MPEEFVTGCAVFLRDGTSRVQALHRGSREDCERTQDLVPAVAVDCDATDARTFVWPAQKWDDFIRGAHGKKGDAL